LPSAIDWLEYKAENLKNKMNGTVKSMEYRMNRTGLMEKLKELEEEVMEGRLNRTEFVEEMREVKEHIE
jgi:uncharacterized coiled-coil DUF342 family protein